MQHYSKISSNIFRGSRSAARGFTIQELLVTIAIGGTITTGAASLSNTVHDTAMTSAANELVSHLNLARSTAVARHAEVAVCPSIDQTECASAGADHTWWHGGWLVYVDANNNGQADSGEVVRVQNGRIAGAVTIRSSRHRRQVTYRPSGTSGGSTITLAVCDARGAASARYVTVSNAGRARVSRATSSEVRCS